MGDNVPILGGNKGLPPPELDFLNWVTSATQAAQKQFPTATIKTADATKKLKGAYGLDKTATYRVDGSSQVTATGDDVIKISDPDDVILGIGDIKDMTTVKFSPWDILAKYTKVQNYNSFRLLRPSKNPSTKNPDQPYYIFSDVKGLEIGRFGATDGKEYKA